MRSGRFLVIRPPSLVVLPRLPPQVRQVQARDVTLQKPGSGAWGFGAEPRMRVARVSSAGTRGRTKREKENLRGKPSNLDLEPEAAVGVVREERKCRKGKGTWCSGSKSRPCEAPGT